MKTIIFVVNTEYHLLVAGSLLLELYGDRERYDVRIVEVAPENSPRFRSVADRAALGVPYEQWNVDEIGKSQEGPLTEKVRSLLELKADMLVIFHDDHPINVYLARKVSESGGKVCLAPDGMKPYYSLDFGSLRNALHVASRTVATYKALRSSGLTPDFLYRKRFGYGSNPDVDELWVRYPDFVRNNAEKDVVDIQLFERESTVEKLKTVFGFSAPDAGLHGIVFYVNNILADEKAYGEEVRALSYLKEVSGGRMVAKLHPNTPEYQVRALRGMGIEILQNSIPAELYITSLSNSAVLGGWSTSLLMRNASCRFYWLRNYFAKNGLSFSHMDLVNPTDHIDEIDDLKSVKLQIDLDRE